MSRKLGLSRTAYFHATNFNTKLGSGFNCHTRFSVTIFKIFQAENRREAFGVSSENILHLSIDVCSIYSINLFNLSIIVSGLSTIKSIFKLKGVFSV